VVNSQAENELFRPSLGKEIIGATKTVAAKKTTTVAKAHVAEHAAQEPATTLKVKTATINKEPLERTLRERHSQR
jgi:hypothetical protein